MNIKELAEQAGFYKYGIHFEEIIERFAELVAAAEREACAKVCESPIATQYGKALANAIRARGDKPEETSMKTTLNKIRSYQPCTEGWAKLLQTLGKTKADDEPLSLITILDSNGLDEALWCLRAVDEYESEMRLFAVWCACQVQHLMTDKRSVDALDVAERFANGKATEKELAAARAAAVGAASAARAAAWNAASAAAGGADRGAAWDAARGAQEKKFRELFGDKHE